MRSQNIIFVAAVLIVASSLIYIGNQLANRSAGFAPNTISVSGEGTATMAPDTMMISLSISEIAPSNTQAQNLVNAKMQELRNFLRSHNIADKDIKTESLSLYEEYDWTQEGRKSMGYRANQQITISIQNSEHASIGAKLLNDIVTIDGIIVNNTSFVLKDRDAAMAQAREQAFAQAKQRAEQLAKAAGLSLKKPVSISDSYVDYGGPIYPMYGRAEMTMDNTIPGIDLPAGEMEVRVQIQVVFETR